LAVGLRPDSLEELTVLPQTPELDLKGPASRGWGRKGEGGKGEGKGGGGRG